MTVISSIINKHCTVHATDSLISILKKNGKLQPIKYEQSKIVPVRAWKGALSYWGLAEHSKYNWSTFKWLKKKAGAANKNASAEDFAYKLAEELNDEISRMDFKKDISSGIGIHFTAYENIEGRWIPELFLIKNFENTNYNSVYPDGIRVFRNTFAAFCNMSEKEKKPNHREVPIRNIVYEVLHAGRWLRFNNGDPIIFNLVAPSIFNMYQIFGQRGYLKDPTDIKTYHDMAHMFIKTISSAQQKFCHKDHRSVGGKPHVLAISPKGEYYSDTGDI